MYCNEGARLVSQGHRGTSPQRRSQVLPGPRAPGPAAAPFSTRSVTARPDLSMGIVADIAMQKALLVFNLRCTHLKLSHVHLRVLFP